MSKNTLTPTQVGIIKWLDKYYGKNPEKRELGDGYYRLVCDPMEYTNPENGMKEEEFAFSYLNVSKSLSIYMGVRHEIENFFDPDIETLKITIGKWFEEKFGAKVVWYGWWS